MLFWDYHTAPYFLKVRRLKNSFSWLIIVFHWWQGVLILVLSFFNCQGVPRYFSKAFEETVWYVMWCYCILHFFFLFIMANFHHLVKFSTQLVSETHSFSYSVVKRGWVWLKAKFFNQEQQHLYNKCCH